MQIQREAVLNKKGRLRKEQIARGERARERERENGVKKGERIGRLS